MTKGKAEQLKAEIAEARADLADLERQFDEEFERLTPAEQAEFMAGRCPNRQIERICEDCDWCEDEIAELEAELETVTSGETA